MSAFPGRPRPTPTPAIGADLQSPVQNDWTPVWFALVEHAWSSLAIVPAHPRQSTRRIAHALAEIARAYDGEEIEVVEAEHILPANVRQVAQRLTEIADSGRRVLLAASSPITNYTAIPLVRKTDAAVMLVPLDVGRLSDIRRAADLIGQSRFLGSITIAANSSTAAAAAPAVAAAAEA